jgi:hypothetical protein
MFPLLLLWNCSDDDDEDSDNDVKESEQVVADAITMNSSAIKILHFVVLYILSWQAIFIIPMLLLIEVLKHSPVQALQLHNITCTQGNGCCYA